MEPSAETSPLPQWALSFLGGVIIGGVAVFAFSPYLLESALGRTVFSQYRVIQGPVTNVDLHGGVLAEGTTDVPTPAESGLSPGASVSAEYRAAGEASLAAFNEMQTLNAQMGGTLLSLNEQLMKGDYGDIADRIAEAKALASKGGALGEQFSASLRAFSEAAVGASADIKSATENAVEAGLSVGVAYAVYLEALLATLGGVPSQAQVETLTQRTQAYTKAVVDFQASVAALNVAIEAEAQ